MSEACDALDPDGNITIKWDIISWTPDGYVIYEHSHLLPLPPLVNSTTIILHHLPPPSPSLLPTNMVVVLGGGEVMRRSL
ncbi:COBRA-like protein 1 [Artemisia annua]|uniref:COBRA-like protein 1 n=1 Tax=Artemisia annua TaxID=35608 RepID=A0A2U1MJR8_ARTAN|nr:COBRA-like protein 1 [Artemisia annua]